MKTIAQFKTAVEDAIRTGTILLSDTSEAFSEQIHSYQTYCSDFGYDFRRPAESTISQWFKEFTAAKAEAE